MDDYYWPNKKNTLQAEAEMDRLLGSLNLNTLCKNAACSNIGECILHGTATFMILGTSCSRNCSFCTLEKEPQPQPNPVEPENIVKAAKSLNLQHIAITSAARDDLPDGGANHFAKTIAALKLGVPQATVEAIVPDFLGNTAALKTVLTAKPDILSHSIETVPALYSRVRPKANYARSLELLRLTKALSPETYTKSGLMVGLGETEEAVLSVMDDLRLADCDVLTIGQYLRPSPTHFNVAEYITHEQFKFYEQAGKIKGFHHIACGPFIRPFYHSAECLNKRKTTS